MLGKRWTWILPLPPFLTWSCPWSWWWRRFRPCQPWATAPPRLRRWAGIWPQCPPRCPWGPSLLFDAYVCMAVASLSVVSPPPCISLVSLACAAYGDSPAPSPPPPEEEGGGRGSPQITGNQNLTLPTKSLLTVMFVLELGTMLRPFSWMFRFQPMMATMTHHCSSVGVASKSVCCHCHLCWYYHCCSCYCCWGRLLSSGFFCVSSSLKQCRRNFKGYVCDINRGR